MKTAIYIENGLMQVVLTPESDLERMALEKISSNMKIVETHQGSFYECQGGWVRHGIEDKSTIFVCRDKSEDGEHLSDKEAS